MQNAQMVVLTARETCLHNAALKRGHAEALGDAADNLRRASDAYGKQVKAASELSVEQWQTIAADLTQVMGTIGEGFGSEASKARAEAAKLLARACSMPSLRRRRRWFWFLDWLAASWVSRTVGVDSPHGSSNS